MVRKETINKRRDISSPPPRLASRDMDASKLRDFSEADIDPEIVVWKQEKRNKRDEKRECGSESVE